MASSFFEIPSYHDFLSPRFADELLKSATPVQEVPDLVQIGKSGGLETPEALQFLVKLYSAIKVDLRAVLEQRERDRKFIDERVRACFEFNKDFGRSITDPHYQTILGLQDSAGRVVMGPLSENYCRPGGKPVAAIPPFLQGPHVTLFGPPSTAKMAVNAMNAYHRKWPNEPQIVEDLLRSSPNVSPMWGADDEDSKTPLRQDLIEAETHLSECFAGTIQHADSRLALDHRALPIKRFPGLALPSSFLFYNRSPIPLHLYDFAIHFFHHWSNEKALVFYVPKLENEEEARYIHKMVATAEKLISSRHPGYQPGSVRLLVVLENPRAILRTHEIMDALDPYFAGASLGWHDYLASMARIFKEDGHYRIPVKADPGIVIKYIKASHRLLADVVGSRGGIKIGGMYGILPIAGDQRSQQVSLRGFIKDVVIQMKRNLTGFWVAHPDFMRLGLALVEAWKQRTNGRPEALTQLVQDLLAPEFQAEILQFIEAPDVDGLDVSHPHYVRSLLVADLAESDWIANNHPDEIRYNVFQTLQYLTDWLSGNGCVALPTVVDGIPVRVMDDLATAERSRWEVWHEIRHGRFAVEDFLKIVHEEMNFIRRDRPDAQKIVQVKYDDRTQKWYPIAQKILIKLITDPNPVEFVTEYLLPFTNEKIRAQADPWILASQMDPDKFGPVRSFVTDFDHYFEVCGSLRFAKTMALNPIEDLAVGQRTIMSFSDDEIIEAASFHGNIGDHRKVLDSRAAAEQARVLDQEESIKTELRRLGEDYLQKFGFKFLISAQGKTADQMKQAMQDRLVLSRDQEIQNARAALWEISLKRLESSPRRSLEAIENLCRQAQIPGISIAIADRHHIQCIALGEAIKGQTPVDPNTLFELASLSKTIAAAFACEYFAAQKIALSTPVNSLFEKTRSSFRIRDDRWADDVTLEHLLSHSALNMHYVNGFPLDRECPPLAELLAGQHGYEQLAVLGEPGRHFHYSGGGFLVLEHLIESLEQKPCSELIRPFLVKLGLSNLTFDSRAKSFAFGYRDDGTTVPTGRLRFPAFAAGALGPAQEMTLFLQRLAEAYQNPDGVPGLSHDTAVLMLKGTDKGAREFISCDMGLGVFVAEAGENRLMIHQGANDGFRALYVFCFSGPCVGRGFTILCNGDNRAVQLIADVAKILFAAIQMTGLDLRKLNRDFDIKGLPQEQIVNLGYKSMLFDSFLPDLPEEIVRKGPRSQLSDANLAARAKVISVSNQKFARAENLLSPFDPVFEPDLYGRQGKIMDSWESARHNSQEFDQMTIELEQPSEIGFVHLSTQFHDGNHAEFVRLMGFDGRNWFELLPKTAMTGHSFLNRALPGAKTCSQVRVEMYPDGGLTRMGLFQQRPPDIAGEFSPSAPAQRFPGAIPRSQKPLTIPFNEDSWIPPQAEASAFGVSKAVRSFVSETQNLASSAVSQTQNLASSTVSETQNLASSAVSQTQNLASSTVSQTQNLASFSNSGSRNLASLALGAKVLRASNEHYSPARQVLSPFPPIHMFDGMESSRSRKAGHHEEVVIQLARPAQISRVELDFQFFVNNNPVAVSIEGLNKGKAVVLAEKTNVKAFAGNKKVFSVDCHEIFEQLRVKVYPDGGINRIKVFE